MNSITGCVPATGSSCSPVLQERGRVPEGIDEHSLDQYARAAHKGFQAGTDLLAVLPSIAETTGYFELTVNPDLSIRDSSAAHRRGPAIAAGWPWPRYWRRPRWQNPTRSWRRAGACSTAAKRRSTNVYVREGDHFEAGDPAVYRRGDENVQQGLRAFFRHGGQGAGRVPTGSSSGRGSPYSRLPRTKKSCR